MLRNDWQMVGNVARASRREFVGINEKSAVGIARIERKHPMIGVLLGALGSVARGQKSASGIWGQASFQSGRLSVVVVSIGVIMGNMLQNHAPEALDVDGPPDLDVVNLEY